LGHAYGGVVALRDIDLDVRQGVVLGVAGANGAGKSTLAGILHGSLVPARGERETGGAVRTSLAPEGRALFKTLSLRERMSASAGALSGGEQRMLAVARALIVAPDVLIVEEPALGLAPALVDEVYDRLARLAHSGVTVVLLEQLSGPAPRRRPRRGDPGHAESRESARGTAVVTALSARQGVSRQRDRATRWAVLHLEA
jgi:branched-chain amino acid transport system permease protein